MSHTGNSRRGGKRQWNDGRRHGNGGRRRGSDARDGFRRDGRKKSARPAVQLPQQVHEDMLRDLQVIDEIKQRQVLCACCGNPITELSTALADRKTGEPVHFDCVLETLEKSERLRDGEKLTYIGQGRFAVVTFPNPGDLRNFSIVRVIEWESRDKEYPWRSEMAGVYSQVH